MASAAYLEGMEVRKRRYLILMGACVALFVLSWFIAIFSAPLAVVVALVACVIPPVAVIVANNAEEDDDRVDWDDDLDEGAEEESETREESKPLVTH
ncbi:DUF3099 family protein [Actinocorallia herbida]|uniref:DUF3099 family protein n=1 Tax=Actinocorallia herbida TaxID=58109 RepID=A0A3N1CU66_9ACTN|nr:DUF3099 domain-containing protein [Actinocorallia herbida]ROO84228.1 DUF3099 family protein [Actinocorallia herbida]